MNQRRSSKGRSSVMELSITILREILKDDRCDLEEITTMMLNNSLPNELRSMAWRIMIGVLPRDKNYYDWVEITQNARFSFNKLAADEEIQDYLKVIRKEEDKQILKQGELLDDFTLCLEKIQEIQGPAHDFFKSQNVRETLLMLYVIWKKNNPDVVTKYLQPFNILAGLIYCLYPSILHHAPSLKEINNRDDVDVKTLYYFLNDEEFFDSDLYVIFNRVIRQNGFKGLINYYSSEVWQDLAYIKDNVVFNEEFLPLNNQSKLSVSKLNRSERICFVYLNIINGNLVKQLINNGIPICQYVESLLSTLLISSISLDQLTYFWDNIFTHSDPSSDDAFNFLDFIIVSLLNNINDLLMNCNKNNWQDILGKYPENRLDSKHIMNKALKFKEKIIEALH